MSSIAKIYGNQILKGNKTINDIPEQIKGKVEEYVLLVDPNFPLYPIEETEEQTEEQTEETNEEPETSPVTVSGGDEETIED